MIARDRVDLSIVICAHEAAGRIEWALRALARQEVPEGISWEVIVVDNASRDGTGRVARAMGEKLGLNLRVVWEERAGLIHARRCGVRAARGEFTSYVDDDNLVESWWVGACVAFMREHPRAGVIGGLIYPVFEDGRERPGDFGEYAVYLAIRELGEEVFEYSLPGDFPPCGAGMTGPTALFRRILTEFPACLTGRKGNSLASGEDVEMGTIAMRLGYESWYAPTLRLGHVLPARRLEKEYLEKLKAGCAEANVWIDYLAGRKQGGGWAGRWGHLGRGVLLGLRAAKLSVLEKLPREDRELLRWWRMESAAQGRTERFLFRRNPWPEVEELLRGTEFRMSESVSS